jgi:hypothetical protein
LPVSWVIKTDKTEERDAGHDPRHLMYTASRDPVT